MPRLTLSDDTLVELPEGEPVGSVLPPEAIAARVGGVLRDLSFVPSSDVSVELVEASSGDGLHVLRHSTAHVLAQAVCDLFPGTRYAIGPPIQDGFYYDFDLPQAIHETDLPAIEDRMRVIVQADQPFVREEVTRDEAIS
ncbi:MAG TPA: threonine--tRNA ligase, partial [Actinomycetota bacterium]|nr:threonine--tRNA ligase [Actinomycetota bacterium]